MAERYERAKILKEWVAHGLLCRVVQNMFHTHNGYVRIRKGHPLYRIGYDKPVALKPNKARWKHDVGEIGFGGVISLFGGEEAVNRWMRTPDGYLKVHGGVTYSSEYCPGEEKKEADSWWFGFDSGHAGDYSPMSLEMKWIHVKVTKDYPDIHSPDEIEKWTTYLRRVEEGEVERDFLYEAQLDKTHYWTLDEVAAEAERLAEQLATMELLGLTRVKGKA